MSTPAPDFAPNRPLRRPIPTARALRVDYYAALASGAYGRHDNALRWKHATTVHPYEQRESLDPARRVAPVALGHRDTPGE